eukprot:CAMPEP_0115850062 /NCGR_PEP_ID=MMETSP0287-20121206/11771_1 /TAXON_ID=412157 /ORGANISM="Chrysochromulina rotalis, Strain UIO044" /LENGTH=370 /DNA_ID=CAMNT_0003304049 /DNA_START=305 /DNA_END=1416 /DNA_ORIENTATION=+
MSPGAGGGGAGADCMWNSAGMIPTIEGNPMGFATNGGAGATLAMCMLTAGTATAAGVTQYMHLTERESAVILEPPFEDARYVGDLRAVRWHLHSARGAVQLAAHGDVGIRFHLDVAADVDLSLEACDQSVALQLDDLVAVIWMHHSGDERLCVRPAHSLVHERRPGMQRLEHHAAEPWVGEHLDGAALLRAEAASSHRVVEPFTMNFDRGGGLVGSVFDSMGANALNANPAWWPSDKALPISAQSFDAFPMSSQCLRSASLPVGVVMASMSSHLLPNEAGIDLGDMIAVGGGSPTVEVAVKLSGSFGGTAAQERAQSLAQPGNITLYVRSTTSGCREAACQVESCAAPAHVVVVILSVAPYLGEPASDAC